ncbi:MAG: glycine/sarcosine/betaine reductase selenoprotein B family protein [Thermodesulfobacteriota bacterium]
MSRFKNRLLARLLTRFPWLLHRAAEKVAAIEVEGVPWMPFAGDLSGCMVALVTTAGVHLRSQEPFDMEDPNGDPSFRELPSGAPRGDYTITHDYYDHTDADKDLNIVYPIDRLKEMEQAGAIGSLAPVNFGFMGHVDGPYIETLIRKTAPEVASRLREEGAGAVLLTPG